MRPLPALAIALALSSGCTAIKATYHVSTADTAVAEAVKFGAPERATYEYTMATRYLEESKEKLGFSQYRSSERLAKKSYEWADKAIISVENRRKVEGEVGFEDQPTPASPLPAPPPPPPAPVVAPAPPATSAWGAPAPVAAPAPASAWGAPAPVPASPASAVVWGAPVPAPAPAAPTAVVIPVTPEPVVEVDMWGIPVVRPGTAPPAPAPAPAPPPPKPKDDFGNLEQDGE